MIMLTRTNSDHSDFVILVKQLDAYLAVLDGEEHAFYNQLNKINNIKHVVVAYEDGTPVGCGAMKDFNAEAMEVKRMFTLSEKRGQGIAGRILKELENWAVEAGYNKCVLETGNRQPEAIALYEKSGYGRTPNYGQYVGVENSVCFEKKL